MDLNQIVQERLSRNALLRSGARGRASAQAELLLTLASQKALSWVNVAAAYRRAFSASRELRQLVS